VRACLILVDVTRAHAARAALETAQVP